MVDGRVWLLKLLLKRVRQNARAWCGMFYSEAGVVISALVVQARERCRGSQASTTSVYACITSLIFTNNSINTTINSHYKSALPVILPRRDSPHRLIEHDAPSFTLRAPPSSPTAALYTVFNQTPQVITPCRIHTTENRCLMGESRPSFSLVHARRSPALQARPMLSMCHSPLTA